MSMIIYKDKNTVVIYKPAGIPSQPDPSGDADAMTLTSRALMEDGEPFSLFPIHRLDRVAEGLLVLARNKRAAAELSALAASESLGKKYLAVVTGEAKSERMTDLIYKDARQGKAFVVDRARSGAKLAELECEPLSYSAGLSLARVSLLTGRFHQIRVQFASRKMPLVGDGKYGSRDKGSKYPALVSYELDFRLFGKRINVKRLPDKECYPWNLFENELTKLEREQND